MAKKVKIPATLGRKKTGGTVFGVKRKKKKTGGALKKVRARGGKPTRAELLSGLFGSKSRKEQKRLLRLKKPEKRI